MHVVRVDNVRHKCPYALEIEPIQIGHKTIKTAFNQPIQIKKWGAKDFDSMKMIMCLLSQERAGEQCNLMPLFNQLRQEN
jgi:hypothetical protein